MKPAPEPWAETLAVVRALSEHQLRRSPRARLPARRPHPAPPRSRPAEVLPWDEAEVWNE